MSRKSKFEWDWDKDTPISSVGGAVFLKELSREEVEARQAALRSKFKGGVDAVKIANRSLAKSDHRGQDALQHFRAAVRAVEISNQTIAKSDGRGQRAIRHLKAAKDAILITNLNQDRYHKHRKEFKPGNDSTATGIRELSDLDGSNYSDMKDESMIKRDEGKMDMMIGSSENTLPSRTGDQLEESRIPSAADGSDNNLSMGKNDTSNNIHESVMETSGFGKEEPQKLHFGSPKFRAAIGAVQIANYMRKYPDVAASEKEKRTEILHKKQEEFAVQKAENESARMELRSMHEEQLNQLDENDSSEKLRVLHEEQKEERDILSSFHKASELESEREMEEIVEFHRHLTEEEGKSGEVAAAPLKNLRSGEIATVSSSGRDKKSKSREALVLALMDEILAEEGDGEDSNEGGHQSVNPFSEAGSKRSLSERKQRETVKESIRSAIARRSPKLSSGDSVSGSNAYANGNDFSERSPQIMGAVDGATSVPGTGLSLGSNQADAIANAHALLAVHKQGSSSAAVDSTHLQLMLSNLLALQSQQQQLQQQMNRRREYVPLDHEDSSVNRVEKFLPRPPLGVKGTLRVNHGHFGGESVKSSNTKTSDDDEDEDFVSMLSAGSAKRMSARDDDTVASLPMERDEKDSLSPVQREMREAAALPTKLHSLGGISEAHAGRPKLLLDNMQAQALTFVREINVIKIQRIVRSYLARLYVDYLRDEKRVREKCAVQTMFDVINEVNVTSSVNIAIDVYADATKADVKETNLMHEIERVVNFLLSEMVAAEATTMVSDSIRELVTVYQKQKHANQSSNPLVQLVNLLLEEVLDDRNTIMVKLSDPLNTGLSAVYVEEGSDGLRRKVESISKSLLLEIVRESINESVQDHLLNTRALEVFEMLFIETVEEEKHYPVVPCLDPSFGVDMIATHMKHSEMLVRERKKRKAARQARLERNAIVRRKKAAAYRVLEKKKADAENKNRGLNDMQSRNRSNSIAIDEAASLRRAARKVRREQMTDQQLAEKRESRRKWKARRLLTAKGDSTDAANTVVVVTEAESKSSNALDVAQENGARADDTSDSRSISDMADGESKGTNVELKRANDINADSIEKILHEETRADERTPHEEQGTSSDTLSKDSPKIDVEEKPSSSPPESALNRSESVTSDLTADTNNITGLTPSKADEPETEVRPQSSAPSDAVSRSSDTIVDKKAETKSISNADESEEPTREQDEDEDVQSHSSLFDTSESDTDQSNASRRASRDVSVTPMPVTFDFQEQTQLIEALNAEEEPVSDEHDSEEEEMQLLALIRSTSSPRAVYGRVGDGEFNDLPIPIPGPITKELYLTIGQISEEALITELIEDICESILTEYTQNRVASFSQHVLDSIEKEFYLEKELIDKQRVQIVARGTVGRNLFLKRLLYHISDNFSNLLLEHFFRGIINREMSIRCMRMLSTAEHQQTRLLVSTCPYDPERAFKYLQAYLAREAKRMEKKKNALKDLSETEESLVLSLKPQPVEERLEPLRIDDLETSTTPLKKLLFKAVVPTAVESIITTFKNANNTLLNDIDVGESYSKGHTIVGTAESLYIKSASGKVITKNFYDYGADSESASVTLSAYATKSVKDSSGRFDTNRVSAASALGINIDDNHAKHLNETLESDRPGSKINVVDVLARLRQKRRIKMDAQYKGTKRVSEVEMERNTSHATGHDLELGNSDAKMKLSNPLMLKQKSGAYEDSDSFSSFDQKFKQFRAQQYSTYAKAMQEASIKLLQRHDALNTDVMSLESSVAGEKPAESLTEQSTGNPQGKNSGRPEDMDPTLKLLRINPRRWFKDEQESRYYIPPTNEEIAVLKAHEEQQRLLLLEQKVKEDKIKAEQEKIMERNKELLKKRVAYLWMKLRDHALVVGKMAKASHLEIEHAPLMAQSDSQSTISTVPLETKKARDQLLADLQMQKELMKDITTFETDENKIIVIQKKTPKK